MNYREAKEVLEGIEQYLTETGQWGTGAFEAVANDTEGGRKALEVVKHGMSYHEAREIWEQVNYEVDMAGGSGIEGFYEMVEAKAPYSQMAREIVERVRDGLRDIGPVRVINCTPHEIRFQNGDKLIEVKPSGIMLAAAAVEKPYGELPGVQFVKTVFEPTEDGMKDIDALRRVYHESDVLLVGSIISAQAYPGRVVSMVPVPGFERVPPAEKRMRNDKFTVFSA